MAELAPHANFGLSHGPVRGLIQQLTPRDFIQRSLLPADKSIGQHFQIFRNPNEVNNVTSITDSAWEGFQEPGLS